MPIVSMFYGIVIEIHTETNDRHHTPHIHARYQDERVVVSLDGEVLAGSIRKDKLRMIQAWIIIHHDELVADWEIASAGEKVFRIEPLK